MAADPYIVNCKLTYSDFGLRQSKMWPSDTLCVTIAGANTAKTAILKIPACFPDSVVGFISDRSRSNLYFVKYSLDMLKADFLAVTRGTTQDNLSLDKLLSFPIWTPPIEKQNKIGDFLQAYDDLIENNTRRIAVLEEMARRIFEEWFVHFRAPGCEGLPMVESPIGPIPQGWEIALLSEGLEELQSGSRPKGGIKTINEGVPSIGAENINGLGHYDYGKERLVPRDFFDGMHRGRVKSGDVMLYKDGAHVGRKALFRDNYPYAECAINEHVFALRPKAPFTSTFVYFWFDTPELTNRIKKLNSNAAQPGINQVGVNGLPLLKPPNQLIERFSSLSEPLLALLFNLAKANRNLQAQRDLLLPKLISGEIDVSAAPALLREAAE